MTTTIASIPPDALDAVTGGKTTPTKPAARPQILHATAPPAKPHFQCAPMGRDYEACWETGTFEHDERIR